jgi:ArsR family transcriptional regulator, virulence genes transcriptional regulator
LQLILEKPNIVKSNISGINTVSDKAKMKQHAKKAAKMMKSLSHESRLMILCLLVEGEKNVGELLESSRLSQSAFSQHLAVLRKEKLVKTRKEAQVVFYSINSPDAKKIISVLHKLYCQ